MKKFFSEQRISEYIEICVDVVLLNLLWLLFCIPIVTIGASTTAMYRVCFKALRGEGKIFSEFWASFKQNLKQATIIWLIVVLVFFVLYCDVRIVDYLQVSWAPVAKLIFGAMAILLLCVTQYVFPLLSQFHNTVPQIFRNAALMSVGYAPKTFLMTVIWALPTIAVLFLPGQFFRFGLHIILFAGALVGHIKAHILWKVFSKYMDEPAQDEKL